MTQPIPQGVFWVYLTDRFHDLGTRADMGDEFTAMWLPRREEFPMSAAADSHPDGIHPPMGFIMPSQGPEPGKTLRDLMDSYDSYQDAPDGHSSRESVDR